MHKSIAPLFVLFVACSSDGFIATDAGGPETTPPGCDLTKEPKDSPTCVDDSLGVFVSVKGADANPGTKTLPLATIGAALKKAPSRIYVCEGAYSATAVISASVGIYGGFDCATWTYNGKRPQITGSLTVYNATGVSLIDLEVDAPDAAAHSGASSVAIRVSSSQQVVLERLKLIAGNGGSGADGTLTPYTFVAPQAGSPVANNGGAAVTTTCPNGETTVGGAGATQGVDGSPGTPGAPNGGSANACAGSAKGGGGGTDGVTHPPAGGAQRLGVLSADGWEPESGGNGVAGAPGQGGGGGSSATNTSGGAGGGTGGCGGAGGGGGKGGGGSFGILAVGSNSLTIRDCSIETKAGGAGGAGVGGQGGQSESGAGGLSNISGACVGGKGGSGGNGGAGGGGAGGPSVGLLYKGSQPDVDSLSQSNIKVGTPGPKGKGAGATNDGLDGTAIKSSACTLPSCG